MGKTSKSFPEYSGGVVQINGRTVATSSKEGNNINTNYDMSEREKKLYDQVQGGMSDSLSNLLKISDPQRQEWSNQLNAIRNQGIQNINDIFTPMETNLRNDVAARFGNMDNSVFMDNLNKITNKKAAAVADLTNSLQASQDSLYSNELANRINIITLLNNLNSAINNNMLNYTNAATANSSAGNSYNNNAYQASQSGTSLLSSIPKAFNNLGLTANTGLSYLSRFR